MGALGALFRWFSPISLMTAAVLGGWLSLRLVALVAPDGPLLTVYVLEFLVQTLVVGMATILVAAVERNQMGRAARTHFRQSALVYVADAYLLGVWLVAGRARPFVNQFLVLGLTPLAANLLFLSLHRSLRGRVEA